MFRVFYYLEFVRQEKLRTTPSLIAAVVILLTCLLELVFPCAQNKLECITYDWRVLFAQAHRSASFVVATNLGFVTLNDQTIETISDGSLGFEYGLYWPRHIYGRVLKELTAQGAKAVAFDVFFANLRKDHEPVTLANGSRISSDDYFARVIKKSGNVILAATPQLMPESLFYTNAWQVGNIGVQLDADGVLRRDRAFSDVRIWHPLILKKAALENFDLSRTQVGSNQLSFYCERDRTRNPIVLDSEGKMKAADLKLDSMPSNAPDMFIPFHVRRIWSMGIVLASRELELDLDHPKIEKHQVTLVGSNGVKRVIPLDASGTFHIDWRIRPNDPQLKVGMLEDLLIGGINRSKGEEIINEWSNRLITVGSIATGNDLTDLGATPLDKETYLVSKHWNVANAVISNQFITLCPFWLTITLIFAIGAVSGWITWNLRPVTGSAVMMLLTLGYGALALWLFVEYRFWLPLIKPCLAAGAVTHAMMATYRVRIESLERNRVKSVFSKMVSPNVVNELLSKENLKLNGRRQDITVLFADIRGFTQLTDTIQTRAEEYIKQNQLTQEDAEEYRDKTARETLEIVNKCLTTISESITRHNGTLDKYIGDCVMAFWGAPMNDSRHALNCARAAIDAQRALCALNDQRVLANKRIEEENSLLANKGLPLKPLLPLIFLGTGINSGYSIVGLMGSESYGFNYTVFGREINLASRLEGISGHGRIVIGENTYAQIKRDDPALAAICIELSPVKVKGFSSEIKSYELPWQKAGEKEDEVC